MPSTYHTPKYTAYNLIEKQRQANMTKLLKGVLTVFFVALLLTGCGAEEDTIKIGIISPNTGALMVYGQSMTDAYKMAVDEINKSGGVCGRQLELVIKDDKMEATETVNCMNSLVADQVGLVIGSVTSACTAAITDIANQEEVILLTPTATEDSIAGGDDFVFRVCFADSFQGAIAAKSAKGMGYSEVGVLYCASDAYSKGIYNAFVKACEILDLQIVDVETVADVALTQDYSNQWSALARSQVGYVFAPFYYYTVGPYLVHQARQAGFQGIIMGGDGYDGANGLQYQTGDLSDFNNVLFINHYFPEEGKGADFSQKFIELYGYSPDAFTALAYDSVYVLADAIERAGSWEPSKVREALGDVDYRYSCVTGDFAFDRTGTPVKGVVIVEYIFNPLNLEENKVETRLRGRITVGEQ